jgi:hypothetical protein
MTALPLGHAKIQTDSRSTTVNNDIVFDNMTRTTKSNTAPSCKETISLNYTIRTATHNKLAIALVEDIPAIDISRTFITDNLSFPIASIKNVVLYDRARLDVSIGRLIGPDLNRLPSIFARPGDILEMVIANDISSRHTVFVYLLIHMQVYATPGDIGKTTISNEIIF